MLPGGCAPTVVKSKGSLEMLSSHLRSVNMGEEEVVIGKRVECFFSVSVALRHDIVSSHTSITCLFCWTPLRSMQTLL